VRGKVLRKKLYGLNERDKRDFEIFGNFFFSPMQGEIQTIEVCHKK
jgi:hypothetical protein